MTDPHKRLIRLRTAAGYDTAGAFALAHGMPETTYRSYENGNRNITPRAARQLAEILKTSPQYLLFGDDAHSPATSQPSFNGTSAIVNPVLEREQAPPIGKPTYLGEYKSGRRISTIPVVGRVRAGAWIAVNEIDRQHFGQVPLPVPERFRGKAFALEVEGTSMNLAYREGTLLVCVRMLDYDRSLTSGRRVIIYRRRDNDLIEATVKEYVIDTDGKAWLWPRSNDPLYQAPIPVPDSHGMVTEDFSDGDGVEIHAIVIMACEPEEPYDTAG